MYFFQCVLRDGRGYETHRDKGRENRLVVSIKN